MSSNPKNIEIMLEKFLKSMNCSFDIKPIRFFKKDINELTFCNNFHLVKDSKEIISSFSVCNRMRKASWKNDFKDTWFVDEKDRKLIEYVIRISILGYLGHEKEIADLLFKKSKEISQLNFKDFQ